jgi:hypothetical protein
LLPAGGRYAPAHQARQGRSVYRLTFDRTHTHIRKIVEMPQFSGGC